MDPKNDFDKLCKTTLATAASSGTWLKIGEVSHETAARCRAFDGKPRSGPEARRRRYGCFDLANLSLGPSGPCNGSRSIIRERRRLVVTKATGAPAHRPLNGRQADLPAERIVHSGCLAQSRSRVVPLLPIGTRGGSQLLFAHLPIPKLQAARSAPKVVSSCCACYAAPR
jgi:hypothetical protein